MNFRHCIVGIVDQWAEARGNYDIEYALCKMTTGKLHTFETDQKEFEEFCDNRDSYWEKNGWKLVNRDGKKTLTPVLCLRSADQETPSTPSTTSEA